MPGRRQLFGPGIGPRLHVAVVGVGLLFLAAAHQVGRWPWLVEDVYAARVGPVLVVALASASSRTGVSLAEVAATVAIPLWVGALLVSGALARRRRQALPPVFARHLLYSASVAVVMACGFYALWGVNYSRPALSERLGWPEGQAASPGREEPPRQELARLSSELVEATNLEYVAAVGTPDVAGSTRPPAPIHELDRSIDQGYERLAAALSLGPAFAASRGPAKAVAASPVLTRLGISGFYFPWTGEANYNYQVPSHQLPLVIAHEKAHQRGIAGEDEASFIGYLAGAHSDDHYVRYSTYLFAQRQLLAELVRIDEAVARDLVSRRLPGVQRDVDAGRDFWSRHQGRASELQGELNDAYLRVHGVEGGIDSYSRAAQLIVEYSRASGGSALVPARG